MIATPDTVDGRKYGRLLARVLPGVIESEAEYTRLAAEFEGLATRGESDLSPEQLRLLTLLAQLIEDYESRTSPIAASTPHEMLRFLMEERGVRQRDLLHIFGSDGIASEVVGGKRGISKAQARQLAAFFKVSIEVFI